MTITTSFSLMKEKEERTSIMDNQLQLIELKPAMKLAR